MPWLLLLMGRCSPGEKEMMANWDTLAECKIILTRVKSLCQIRRLFY